MNTGAVLSGTGLTVPIDFPTHEFEIVYKKLRAHSQKKHQYDLAIGAMHAISYRFTALAEYDDRFTASIKAHGRGPAPRIRYEQERDLFGFFSNAFSIFDTFCFVLFGIGSLTSSNSFPLLTTQDERNVTWAALKKAYNAGFSGDPILGSISND